MTAIQEVEEIRLPKQLEKLYDPKIQKMLVLDYFVKNKSITYISNNYSIPIYDLKFYFYTAEAQSIYKRLKDELSEYPQENSLKYVRELLVDKLEELIHKTNGKESADIIEKIVPQIIMLQAAIVKTEGTKRQPFNMAFETAQEVSYEDIEDGAMHDLESVDIGIKTESPILIENPEVLNAA